MNTFKKFLTLVILLSLSTVSYAASERDRMNIFLSNFTEVSLFNFDIDDGEASDTLHLGNPENIDSLIYFGVAHNFINNKKLIQKCKDKDCDTMYTISYSSVAASVKKYFDIDLGKVSKGEISSEITFDGKNFHFDAPIGTDDTIYYADIKEVDQEGKLITMTGEIYNIKNKKDRPATFIAQALPYKWNGKKTWSIYLFKTEWKDD